jgi:hypothetical protein
LWTATPRAPACFGPRLKGTTMNESTNDRTVLATKPGAEKKLIREISQLAKYTGLNSETDLKQPRNEVETEVKYSNPGPDGEKIFLKTVNDKSPDIQGISSSFSLSSSQQKADAGMFVRTVNRSAVKHSFALCREVKNNISS